MEDRKVVVKYFSRKMFLTLDLNKLVEVLIEVFGDSVLLELEVMSDGERKRSSRIESGLVRVLDRFLLFVEDKQGHCLRRQDLEQRILAEGRK